MLRQFVGEVEPNEGFMQQLAQYDLELLSLNEWVKANRLEIGNMMKLMAVININYEEEVVLGGGLNWQKY